MRSLYRIEDRPRAAFLRRTANRISVLFLLLFLLPGKPSAQEVSWSEKEIIGTLVTYRSELLRGNPAGIGALRRLELKLGSLDRDTEEFAMLALNLLALQSLDDYTTKTLLRIAREDCVGCEVVQALTEEDIEIILTNAELLDLVLEGVLQSSYPYQIDPRSSLFAELAFYQVQPGDRVAEIGAGNGTFGLLLAMLAEEITLTINEIEKGFVRYIEDKFGRNQDRLDLAGMEAVKGTKTNPKLADEPYDRIIIRNAFHHFEKKEKMLDAIRRALQPGGKLYLYEPVLREMSSSDACALILSRTELLSIIAAHGFTLEAEEWVNGVLLLRFGKA